MTGLCGPSKIRFMVLSLAGTAFAGVSHFMFWQPKPVCRWSCGCQAVRGGATAQHGNLENWFVRTRMKLLSNNHSAPGLLRRD
jgi:hypothetical protein